MRGSDIARYALWCGVAVTAEANRREYRMATVWLPHFAANTLSLLLPDLLRVAPRGWPGSRPGPAPWRLLAEAALGTARDRPDYVLYVAPLAAGYQIGLAIAAAATLAGAVTLALTVPAENERQAG